MTTDKFDGEYLEHRKIGLERFMQRIASHPVLHQDNVFKAFLMKGEEWKSVGLCYISVLFPTSSGLPVLKPFSFLTIPTQVADSTEFRAKNEGFLKGIQASYQLKNCDSRFSELKTYADELETRVNAILR